MIIHSKERRDHRRTIRGVLCITIAAALAGCVDLDLTNPNAPSEETVITDVDGLVALAVGMQDIYAAAIEDFVVPSALITDEWGTTSRSLTSYQSLLNGENFDASYGVVSAPWSNAYAVVRSANTLIRGTPTIVEGEGLQAGMLAVAELFKAMSLGAIIQIYEQVPVDITVEGPVPQPREVVLDSVLALLESARGRLDATTDDQLAGFRSRVLPADFDIRQVVNAMLARFYLLDGQYQQAIDAAARVPLDALNRFTYTTPDINPIQNLALGLIYVAPLRSFADQAEPGDGRPAFWADVNGEPFFGNPPDTAMLPLAEYVDPQASFPVYLPDELRLIQAESHARLGDLNEARRLINEVRTQSSSPVDEPVANLPALDADDLPDLDAVLRQIAYERRYELFNQGLRWEDTRRLPQPFGNTVVFDWLPIPDQECQSNPSSPCG
jgi:hypothetical protein